ncbi:MSHA biogenesis protein MshI [Gammaproteobacteria bacterium]
MPNILNPLLKFSTWARRRFAGGGRSTGLVGIGFSSQGIALARIETAQERPRLTLLDFQPCDTPQAWGMTLTELAKRHGLQGQPCVGCLEGQSYQFIPLAHPGLADAELREALRWQVREMLNFPAEEAVTDYLEPPVQRSGSRILVAVAQQSIVADRAQLIQQAGFNLVAMDVRETALRNLASRLPQNRQGVALIGFSWEDGLLTVSHQGRLVVTRTLDTGERSLRNRIPDGDDWNDATIVVLDHLVLEVQRLFDYHDSHFQQPPVAALFLPPGTRRAPIFERYFRANLSVNVLTLDLKEIFEIGEDLSPEQQNLCLFAVGAAARCLDGENADQA